MTARDTGGDPHGTDRDGIDREVVLYLTSIQCHPCQRFHTFAHVGGRVPIDQEAPWPAVKRCPWCGSEYPDDLAEVITEVAEAERVDPEAGRDV